MFGRSAHAEVEEPLAIARAPEVRRGPARVVRFEQAVYGSFPFWDRGYAFLGHSPGCRPEWLAEFRQACQEFGEPPHAEAGNPALFARRLKSGVWAIVGISAPGTDDQGRPGALAFHALFLTWWQFRKAAFNPFCLTGSLRTDWGPTSEPLRAGWCSAERDAPLGPQPSQEVDAIVEALCHHRKLVLESSEPIEDLARAVWARLPARVRRRAAVATLAYGDAAGFDLAAVPHAPSSNRALAGLAGNRAAADRLRRLALPCTMAVCLIAVANGLLLLGWPGRGGDRAPEPHKAASPAESAPDRSRYRGERADPEEQARVVEALTDVAERFGIRASAEGAGEPGATQLMIALADHLRYRGPFLSDAELARLRADHSPEALRALTWHEHMLRFAADRPLPPDFARGPLRWQLDTLGWSFHVSPDPRLSAAEVPIALGDALAVEGTVRPSSLVGQYPALRAYGGFLGRMPRR